MPIRLVGKHCESGDLLVREGWCRPTSPSATSSPRRSPVPTGTRWGPTTTRSLRPPVVFVRDGDARLVVRRETVADLLATDLG
jgi:diaminopimelate decarboxylase